MVKSIKATVICVICVVCGVKLSAAPRQAKLVLLLVADLSSLARPGGEEDLARLSAAVKSERDKGELVLGLVGNFSPPAQGEGEAMDAALFSAYLKHLAPRVAVLGDTELEIPAAVIKGFLKSSGLVGLTSNIIDSDGCAFRNQYYVIRTSGVKATFLGVSPTEKGKYHGYALRDPTSTVRGYRNVLSRMRGGIGLTVALACLPSHRAKRLSADVPAVDLVVSADGNSVNAFSDNEREEEETGRRLVLSLGGRAPQMVKLELKVRRFDPRDWDITGHDWQEISWWEEGLDKEALSILRGEVVEKEAQEGETE